LIRNWVAAVKKKTARRMRRGLLSLGRNRHQASDEREHRYSLQSHVKL
jgi:hypothetical protein